MELYEVLKSGTSPEELEETFHKELASAMKRISEEQRQEQENEKKKSQIKDCREALAESICLYKNALLGKAGPTPADIKKVEKQLAGEEEALIHFMNIIQKTAESLSINKLSPGFESDDDIIERFIKNL